MSQITKGFRQAIDAIKLPHKSDKDFHTCPHCHRRQRCNQPNAHSEGGKEVIYHHCRKCHTDWKTVT
jgi:hypothetical protein